MKNIINFDVHVRIEDTWKQVLNEEFEKPYFASLVSFVKKEYSTQVVYPPAAQIFAAFDFTPFSNLKVVILGQDPYHGEGQAHGLCFSVNDGVKIPPSLANIYKELQNDLGTPIPATGNLTSWAKQGVLLLNATLTVRSGMAGSHQNRGWETFTDAVIKIIDQKKQNIVFMLWGNYAKNKSAFINPEKHLVLTAAHPSPFSAAKFLGCKHFSAANNFLIQKGLTPIHW